MKYVKKPLVVTAVQWNGNNREEILSFLNGSKAVMVEGNDFFYINTLEGDMRASKGDYIIKGFKGEFYPCKPDIFKATYDVYKETIKIEEREDVKKLLKLLPDMVLKIFGEGGLPIHTELHEDAHNWETLLIKIKFDGMDYADWWNNIDTLITEIEESDLESALEHITFTDYEE